MHLHQINDTSNLFGRRFAPPFGDTRLYGVDVGVTDHLEVGVSRVDTRYAGDDTVFRAKYRFELEPLLGTKGAPDVAVGVWDFTSEINRGYFLVLSKRLTLTEQDTRTVINAHLGFGDNEEEAGALDGVFGGVDFTVNKQAIIQAEFDGEQFNALVRWKIGHRLTVDGGAVDGDFTYGISFNTQEDYKRAKEEWGGYSYY